LTRHLVGRIHSLGEHIYMTGVVGVGLGGWIIEAEVLECIRVYHQPNHRPTGRAKSLYHDNRKGREIREKLER
jgi:hypothetical protein